jgi:hypothetical protein
LGEKWSSAVAERIPKGQFAAPERSMMVIDERIAQNAVVAVIK